MFRHNDGNKSDDVVGSLVADNTEFALALYQRLRAEAGNLFFSPHNISTALAMTYAGDHQKTGANSGVGNIGSSSWYSPV